MTEGEAERFRAAVVHALRARRRDWVVDVGAGPGELLARIGERVVEARLIAVDPARVRAPVDRAPGGTRRIQGDGRRLPFRDISVHSVILSFALHHMDAATRRRVLAEARRVLRRNGRLVVIERTEVRGLRRLRLRWQTWLGREHPAVWELQAGGLERELRAFDFVPDVREEARERLILGCTKP